MAAADAKVVLENKVDGYLTEDKQVKGGWLTVSSVSERDSINKVALKNGSLCYCTADDKFYKYNGTTWTEKEMGGGHDDSKEDKSNKITNISGNSDIKYTSESAVKNYVPFPSTKKRITNGFINAFRTQTKGDSSQGTYLNVIRGEESFDGYAIYSAGLAFGDSDTHSYIVPGYSSPSLFVGGGNANKLLWYRDIIQDLDNKQNRNLVTSINSSSDDTHYPSAKAVYNYHDSTKENISNRTTSISSASSIKYPTEGAVKNYTDSHSPAGRLTSMLIPGLGYEGKSIAENADLNTLEYTKIGRYTASLSATAGSLTNCPTKSAFIMEVHGPLSDTLDNESGAWCYRLKIIKDIESNVYIQNCSTDGSGVMHYGKWNRMEGSFHKVAYLSESSTHNQYPSAKAVWDLLKILVPMPTKRWYEYSDWWNYCSQSTSAATTADIGREVNLTVNGQVHKVRLIGIDHDDLADLPGKAHCTFEFVNVISDANGYSLATYWKNAASEVNTNHDYLNSSIRKALTGEGNGDLHWFEKDSKYYSTTYSNRSVLDMLPSSLKEMIKPVRKHVNIYSNNKWVLTEYTDRLFLPTPREMGYSGQYTENVPTYKYYEGHTGEVDSIRTKVQVRGYDGARTTSLTVIDGEYAGTSLTKFSDAGYNATNRAGEHNGTTYWTCSPQIQYSSLMWRHDGYTDKLVHSYGVSLAMNVAPAFCI